MGVWQFVQIALLVLIAVLGLLALLKLLSVQGILTTESLKKALEALNRKKKFILICVVVFIVVYSVSEIFTTVYFPQLLVRFNYEEASKGQNPNRTIFNVSEVLSDEILEKVIEKGNFSVKPEQLAKCLFLESAFDEEKIDIEKMLNVATEYRVVFEPDLATIGINGKKLMNTLADVYYEDFLSRYTENTSILELDFTDSEGMDYRDMDSYFQMKAQKLLHYMQCYSYEAPKYRAENSTETFASVIEKINNFANVEIEKYRSLVLEKGLSNEAAKYKTKIDYERRLFQTEYDKGMAAYNVRLEAINMYDPQMAQIVLVPTNDPSLEFYMSRTKIGVDYFASEAGEALSQATEVQEQIAHNDYFAAQMKKSIATEETYLIADTMIEDMKAELYSLAEDCKNLGNAYISEKRDGYIQVDFAKKTWARDFLVGLMVVAAFTGVLGAYTAVTELKKETYKKNKKEGATR